MKERKVRMSGFADEASPDIDVQIAVHAEAGWDSIELRTVNGKNVCEMDDSAFDGIFRRMMDAGMRASCIGSPIANWARPITTPFGKDVEDLKRAIPRMRMLHTNLIRVMSYPNAQWPVEDWRREVFRRFEELVRIAEGEGVVMVLENCDGWASESPQNFRTMLETFDSPALRAVYDTGNTVSHKGTTAQTWEFYHAALPYIVHFHIKDCKLVDGSPVHTYPGEGDSDVLAIMKDLHSHGYAGMYSIEPHIHTQVHLKESTTPAQKQLEMYRTYTRMANTFFDQLLL